MMVISLLSFWDGHTEFHVFQKPAGHVTLSELSSKNLLKLNFEGLLAMSHYPGSD